MGGTTILPWDCSAINADEIYYRNAWIGKFEATTCSNLWAISLWLSTGGLEFFYPSPPFLNFARIRPPFGAVWDGSEYIAPGCE